MLTLQTLLGRVLEGNRPYILALIVLNSFFFGDVLFTDDTFFYRDIGSFHQPLKKLVTEAYSQGEWPLWNPYFQFGQPLLANPNAMAVYPTQVLFHLFPFDFAFDLNLVLHCLIGALGAFYLARALNLSPIAAFSAGLAYNFNGVILSLINLPLLAAIGGLLPWLALFLRRVIHNPSAKNLGVSALLFGLLLLLLEPLTTYAVFLFLVPFGAYSFLSRPTGVQAWKIAVGLLIILVSGFCLAGIQILPTLEMLQNSGREEGLPFEAASFWSVHPLSLTQMLFPHIWRDAFDLTGAKSAWSLSFFSSREAYLVSCYPGLSCLMIALLGLFFSERYRLKWLLFAVAVVAVTLALGKYTPVHSLLFHYLPPFQLGRYPAKYLLTTTLCLSLLAGLGVEQLKQFGSQPRSLHKKARLALYFVLIGAVLLASGPLASRRFWQLVGLPVVDGVIKLTYQGEPFTLNLSILSHSVLYLWMVLTAGLLLVFFCAVSRRVRASSVAFFAAALLFFDLLTNHTINPLVHANAYEPSPVTEWLVTHAPPNRICRVYHIPERESPYLVLGKTDSWIWRFLFDRLSASPYTAAGHHVQYSSFMPIDRLETLTSQFIDRRMREMKDLGEKLDYLAELNTGYILSMNPIHTPLLEWKMSFDLNSDRLLHIYRLKTAQPRAYLADLGVLDRGKGDLRTQYDLSPEGTKAGSRSDPGHQSIVVRAYSPGAVDLSATARKVSMLVLLDSYYPGWRVWVDGRERRVEKVRTAFRGVILEPGQHQVTFRYDPKSFRYGLALTLSTVAAWLVVFIFLFSRRTTARKKPPAPAYES